MSLSYKLFNGYYYETPDYQDCAKKTWVCLKIGAAASSVLTFNHLITAESHVDKKGLFVKIPKTFEYAGRTFARYGGPVMSVAFLGSSITCALAKLRGNKDDPWNHFFGWGIITGLICSRKVPHVLPHSGHAAGYGLYAAIAAFILKKGDLEDFNFVSNRPANQRRVTSGTYGGDDWGDWRFGYGHTDPGRRPNN